MASGLYHDPIPTVSKPVSVSVTPTSRRLVPVLLHNMLSWPQDRQRWEIAPPTPKARFPSTKSTLSGHQKHAFQTPKACFPSTKSTLSKHQKHAPRTPRQFAFPHRNQKTRAPRPLTWSTHTPAGLDGPRAPLPTTGLSAAPRPPVFFSGGHWTRRRPAHLSVTGGLRSSRAAPEPTQDALVGSDSHESPESGLVFHMIHMNWTR